MSGTTSGAPPLEVGVVRPALFESSFYQVMLLMQTVGAVAPDHMQLDHAIEKTKKDDTLAKATLRVQNLTKRKSDKDALADRRFNFCHQIFLDNCYENKKAKYFKPKYYVRMMEKEEKSEKGSLDHFIDNGKVAEWIDRFEELYALPPIPEDTVCGICGRGDGKIFQCDAPAHDGTEDACECLQHALCAGYRAGEEPSEALCANVWHQEHFNCKKHFGTFALSRNSEAEKAAKAERDAELIEAAVVRQHFKKARANREQLAKQYFKNTLKRKNVIETFKKRKVPEVPETPKTLLISNGGAAGAQSVDPADKEIVPHPDFCGQWKSRDKWSFKHYYKKITKNKDEKPHVIVMMHPDSSLEDVKEWHNTFARQWHPDKNSEVSADTNKKMTEMFGIFKTAIDLLRKSIKSTKKKKDKNADKHDAEILKQQEKDRSSDDSDDDEETTDDEA